MLLAKKGRQNEIMESSSNEMNGGLAYQVMVGTGCLTIVLATALAYVLMESRKKRKYHHDDQQNDIVKKMNDNDNPGLMTTGETNDDQISGNRQQEQLQKYPGGIIHIYYGTQTGTSESFARIIEREGITNGFDVRVVDLEEVTALSMLRNNRCIFLVATYGEGEPPDNATQFVHLIQQHTQLDLLFEKNNAMPNDVNTTNETISFDYCVFGLGNKQYDNYNSMGKYFNKSLELLGGNKLVDVGLGNDDDDIENDFNIWKDTILWPTLSNQYLPKTTGCDDDGTSTITATTTTTTTTKLPDCPYHIQYDHIENYRKQNQYYFDNTSTSQDIYDTKFDHIHNSNKHYFTAVDCPITTIRELRNRPMMESNHDDMKDTIGSTIHLEIDISHPMGGDISYITADNLGVLPINTKEIVDTIARSIQFDGDGIDTTLFMLRPSLPEKWHGIPFPMPITIRECLTRYCDVTGLLKRADLKMLSYYATDPVDESFLLRISSSSNGLQEYREKIVHSYIGLMDILQLCPSISIPLEHFLALCSPIQARYYTISSSSSLYPKSIHITVAVTSHIITDPSSSQLTKIVKKPSIKSSFKGLCSNYLANCRVGENIRIFIRPSTFRLPKDISIPILMIGPGTGIAPMRAMIQERQYQYEQQQSQKNENDDSSMGNNILYFGCKRSHEDYIYQNELEQYSNYGILHELHVAFSREDPNRKVYVQHLLQQNKKQIYQLMQDRQCYIYVCGGVKMGQDVHETIKDIMISESSNDEKTTMNENTVKEYLNKLSHEHRYVQELWA